MGLPLDGLDEELRALCLRLDVRRLELFGSASTGAGFDPARSDLDFIVEFSTRAQPQLFERFFALKQGLETLTGRPVDLLSSAAIRNPYMAAEVQRTRREVYASTHTEAA